MGYFLGLDIGTDSVGYAVTDEKYNILKFHGEPAWGTTIFDRASLNDERRGFRSARRRLDRRQQRVSLIQELFADEIRKIDPRFFIRLEESSLFREDAGDRYVLFDGGEYTDREFFADYPTIHHLICDLMENNEAHDARLVYLACAWLVAHRGHFLSNIDINNIDKVKDINSTYNNFISYFTSNGYDVPWNTVDAEAFGDILKTKMGVVNKTKAFIALLYGNQKPGKEAYEEFPFSREAIVKLLAGGTCKLKELFNNDDYDEFGSVSLQLDDDKFGEIMANIGDDYNLIEAMRGLYDWAVLVDVIGNYDSISRAKVAVYDQHRTDLVNLKYLIRKYIPSKYNEVFRDVDKDNYVSYAYHSDEKDTDKLKKKDKEAFSKYLMSVLKGIQPDTKDKELFESILERLELRTFMPKQKNTDNRVIPHQLYQFELVKILDNASHYLPMLNNQDEEGITVRDKIISVFLFRIPYFVGPLNSNSKYAWIERKAGKIYPWNFNDMVDLDASEQNFIERMTNKCTYLPDQPVLPKSSLLYQKFTVLNEINNIRINGVKLTVEQKQDLFTDLFCNVKKVTKKKVCDYLICNGILIKGMEDTVSGVDDTIGATYSSYIGFRRLLDNHVITEADAERIIERASYAEDKSRLSIWLTKNYPTLDEADRKYICNLKLKDFGRLSRALLSELEGVDKSTGEVCSIIGALWNTQSNLMELLSESYTFNDAIQQYRENYYSSRKQLLADRLDDMYISNAVKRPIYRTLDIVKDVKMVFGYPTKIFIEVTRGEDETKRGRRTKSRKDQILELYSQCKDEDVKVLKKQLEDMGEYADNKLQGDKLFLYYMQLGKCMYSGEPIELSKLATKEYDIDHIYPQAYVKDDSIINNRVLCLSKINGDKSDTYPLANSIRHSMASYWEYLNHQGLISEEKYKRLIRSTPFTEEEKYAFISRQLTETSQSTKAVATLLKEHFPETEIVYCRAKLVSEFRQEFDLYKCRSFNDLHHAVDAYLNIVTGNVYSMKFTKKWFNINSKYSINTKAMFTHPLICNGNTVWDGEEMLGKVKRNAVKNNAHFTKYSYFKKGGLFDQMPVPASEGLIPRKNGLDTAKYGGYNKAGCMFYIPTRYYVGKKNEVIIMSVELLHGDKFLNDIEYAEEYAYKRLEHILGKKVDKVEFPMGMRPWKVNTVLSLDGFKVCISGIASGGKCLIAQPVVQFAANSFWQFYLKKVERLVEKIKLNTNYQYSEEYDNVSTEKNIELYDLYIDKYANSIYKKRINSPINIIVEGREKFINLDVRKQCEALLAIHQSFGRISSGCDLTLIGGSARTAATVNFSSTISNWKKLYSEVRLIDSSASGMFSTESINLFDIL